MKHRLSISFLITVCVLTIGCRKDKETAFTLPAGITGQHVWRGSEMEFGSGVYTETDVIKTMDMTLVNDDTIIIDHTSVFWRRNALGTLSFYTDTNNDTLYCDISKGQFIWCEGHTYPYSAIRTRTVLYTTVQEQTTKWELILRAKLESRRSWNGAKRFYPISPIRDSTVFISNITSDAFSLYAEYGGGSTDLLSLNGADSGYIEYSRNTYYPPAGGSVVEGLVQYFALKDSMHVEHHGIGPGSTTYYFDSY